MSQTRCHSQPLRPACRAAMVRTAALLGTAIALLGPAQTFAATPPRVEDRRELGYFLPKTKVVATVAQQILRCPTAARPEPEIETRIGILDRGVPDVTAFVRVDARSGFLAERTTKLTLRADGTLETFNATTEGQGGAVLAAAIKTVAVVGAGMFGGWGAAAGAALGLMPAPSDKTLKSLLPPPPPRLTCTAKITALVARRDMIIASLAKYDEAVESGTATSDQRALAARNREALATVDAGLTLVAAPVVFDPIRGDAASIADRRIDRVEYETWFGNRVSAALLDALPGRAGFSAQLRPDRAMLDRLGPGDGSLAPDVGARPYLLYRRPIPATLTVAPCTAAVTPCPIDADSDLTASKMVALPQLSGFFSIRIGRGGLFGTRQASARFDESGAPLELEYGSSSGGESIAGVIDAGREGFTTMHDAPLTARQRRKDILTADAEIDALEKALAAGSSAPPAGH